jgi:predicted DNA-binding ribbon-helix-helix protein
LSLVRKRSVSIGGHRTSYSVEDEFQAELARIAAARSMALAALIAEIDAVRAPRTNLSSALRLYVLDSLKRRLARQG